MDLQKPGTKPVEKSEVAGLFGVTKVVGFTPKEKSSFTPLTIADSLGAQLADTLGTLPRDVAQALANCYWAASLHAVLGADPHFLDDRVTRRGATPGGVPIYAVRIHSTPLLGGRERTVFVEASLPGGHLKPTGPNGLQDLRALRAVLYEKAFAQALGGYDELEWGNSGRAMRNMTGNPSAYTFMELADADRLFKKIERRHAQNRPMVLVAFDLRDYMVSEDMKLGLGNDLNAFEEAHGDISGYTGESAKPRPDGVSAGKLQRLIRFSEKRDARDPSNFGIVDQHCYSIVNTHRELVDGKTVKLVELRDPRHPDQTFTKTIVEVQQAFFMMVTNHL